MCGSTDFVYLSIEERRHSSVMSNKMIVLKRSEYERFGGYFLRFRLKRLAKKYFPELKGWRKYSGVVETSCLKHVDVRFERQILYYERTNDWTKDPHVALNF